jgi:hypothetical protein
MSDELEIDVRSVAVIWTEDDDTPNVSYSGCSTYEALGLLVCGAVRLALEGSLLDDPEDEDG